MERKKMNCCVCGKDLTDVRPIWSISQEEGPQINYCESCYSKEFTKARNRNDKDWAKDEED